MDFYKDAYGWKVGNGYTPAGKYDLRIVQTKIYVDGLKQLANGYEVTAMIKNEGGDPYVDIPEFLSSTYEFFNAVVAGSSGEINTINGKYAGTFFGDDFTVTRRVPVLAAKWSQGMPLFAIDLTFNTSGSWYIPADTEAPTYPDSVSIFESGTDPAGLAFITSSQPNRYEPGHLSYFGYTVAFKGVNSANGDFTALIGAFLRGSATTGQQNQIKDGLCWGFVRSNGVLNRVLRVYKNFEIALEKVITGNDGVNYENLQIIEHQVGFYGIHPSVLWLFDSAGQKNQLFDFTAFNQDTCSIHDPNLSIGVYVQNQGNTNNIQVLNGSLEYGNYTERNTVEDSSGRNIADKLAIASLAVDSDPTDGGGFVAAYRVTDSFESYDSVNAAGSTTRLFQSKIENVLISLVASGSANRAVRLNLYMIPLADIVATFSPVLPYVSVLEKALTADVTSVDFTNAQLLFSTLVTESDPSSIVLAEIKPRLRPGSVAILACECSGSTTLSDLIVDLNTLDLF